MKKYFLALMCLSFLGCISQTEPSAQYHTKIRVTKFDVQKSSGSGDSLLKINKLFYTIEYDMTLKSPLYTYYTLYNRSKDSGRVTRTTFHMDDAIPYMYQSGGGQYKLLKGYDKGHLSPDDDFRFDSAAESQSMIYTNCAPQVSAFNRGIWKSIENYARFNAENYDSVKVYTGVVYSADERSQKGLLIPSHFFKVMIFNGQEVCFLAENRKQETDNIFDLKVPVDSIKGLLNQDYKDIIELR